MKLDFRVPEVYLSKLKTKPGSLASRPTPIRTRPSRAASIALEPSVDEKTRTVVARALIPNQQNKLRPGMFARVNVLLETRARCDPRARAGHLAAGARHVRVRWSDGKAVLTKIELGVRRPGEVEVVEGPGGRRHGGHRRADEAQGRCSGHGAAGRARAAGRTCAGQASVQHHPSERRLRRRAYLQGVAHGSIRYLHQAAGAGHRDESCIIVLVGFLSFTRMAVREYPNIDPPVVSVRTVYKGATAQVMESAITQPLEDSLSGIEGIKTIKSQSREEVSQITITFVAAREIDGAANDVRDRVARIRKNMPAASDNPVVSKIEADAQPIMWIALTSDRHSPMEMTRLRGPLSHRSAQGAPRRGLGDHRRRAQVRDARLARPRAAGGAGARPRKTSKTRSTVRTSIRPAGASRAREREFTVQARTDLRSPEEFNNMIIKEVNGYPIRLRDVGPRGARPVREPQDRARARRGCAGVGHRQAVHRQHARSGAMAPRRCSRTCRPRSSRA